MSNETDLATPEAQSVEAAAQPVLSDEGIGLSLEDVKALLAMKHKMIIDADDPVLMMVTLHNAFLAEEQKLFSKHEKALKALMNAETSRHLTAIDGLTEKVTAITAEGVSAAAEKQLTATTNLMRDIRWLGGGIILAALANAIVLFVGK